MGASKKGDIKELVEIALPKSQEQLNELLKKAPEMKGLELASKVSTTNPYESGKGKYKVALIDFGVKKNWVKETSIIVIRSFIWPLRKSPFKDIFSYSIFHHFS